MLKKIGIICASCCISAVQAGTMGEVSEELSLPSSFVFIAAEGGWTWNGLGGLNVNINDMVNIFSTKEVNRGSARVSMGAQKYFCHSFAAIGEIGYGYYGKTGFNIQQSSLVDFPDLSQIKVKVTNDGFDVLGGLSYSLSSFDVFFKAGAMIENSRYKPTANLDALSSGNLSGSVDIDINSTQVFPEIKLGGAYHVCKNLSLTAAWMHVFGESPHVGLNISLNQPILAKVDVKTQNPTLDAFFLGAAYTFSI